MKKAEYFHFTRVVAQEGGAVLPLLELWEKQRAADTGDGKDSGTISPDFLREVKEETARMAHFYPDYLKTELVRTEIFTEKELGVLKLLCQGISTKEICERCGITYNSLKFHKKNIYKKLGVKNRQDAERKASLLEL